MINPQITGFRLGRIFATPGVLHALERNGQMPAEFLKRHLWGDWGKLGKEDCEANDLAIANEGEPERRQRVLSAYLLKDKTKIWVITEHDRSSTTILLPSEY